MKRGLVLAAALATFGFVAPAWAQVELSTELGVFSDYVWRGLSPTSRCSSPMSASRSRPARRRSQAEAGPTSRSGST